MPLLDHFHPPLKRLCPWRSFHGTWAVVMADLLNEGVLPPGFEAFPFLDRDGPVEIDVATLERPGAAADPDGSHAQLWTPPAAGLSLLAEWPDIDDVRVEILSDDGDPPMAAAIELVSPGNKDRRQARRAFASKCAENLRRGCGVVVVDLVTFRRADLRSDLLAALDIEAAEPGPGSLSAVSYRSVGERRRGARAALPLARDLELGQPLPTLPLWLGGDVVVPLDLEASYRLACARRGLGETQ